MCIGVEWSHWLVLIQAVIELEDGAESSSLVVDMNETSAGPQQLHHLIVDELPAFIRVKLVNTHSYRSFFIQ